MSLLRYREYDKYVLKYLNDIKKEIHKSSINENVAKMLISENIMQESDKSIVLENKNYFAYDNRIDWSLVYLKQAELITTVSRGVYQITDFGIEFYNKNSNFDFKYIKENTPFLANRKNKIIDDNNINN